MRVRMASLQASLVQRSGPKRSIMDLVRSVALNFFTPAASLTIWNIASDSSSLVTGSAMLASSRLDVYGTLEAQPGVPEVVLVLYTWLIFLKKLFKCCPFLREMPVQ